MDFNIETSWKKRLQGEFYKPYFATLTREVENAYARSNVWPQRKDLFKAFEKCPINEVKVVILGQDPYPTPGHANGLCFSVNDEVKPFPKSLNNIFKEIKNDLGIAIPENGNLERWAKQGVLLLNSTLTVEAHAANSHQVFGWEIFTDAVISEISKSKENIVFMLWGTHAQKKKKLINLTHHHVLTSVHPSPLSAYRGFFGSKHFRKANELLISQQLSPINW